jgi:hypothetical protein
MTPLTKRLFQLGSHPLSWIILLSLVIRVYACLASHIINPDGIHYIHQARSIFYGEWDNIAACQLKSISILPVFIASVFAVVQDWITAGRTVSVFFGTATLFPLYFILQRFMSRTVSLLTLLLYALMPVLVSRSVNIVRGPIFWFFLSLGMLYFIRQLDEEKQRSDFQSDLYLSCICLLIATWTRMEGVYAIFVSGAYILIANRQRKMVRFLSFSTPIILILIAGTIGFTMVDTLAAHHLRLDRLANELTQFLPVYDSLRDHLKVLIVQSDGWLAEFFHHVRTLLWLMPLSIIFNSIWESFFYPYALVYAIGFIGLRQRLKADRRIGYFLWLSVFSIVVLYVHLLQTWLIFQRFMLILILPSCIIVGFGIDNILRYLQHRFGWSTGKTVNVTIALIVLFALPKALSPRERDKAIFAEAGQIIAQQKNDDQTEPIMGVCSTAYRWIYFYAHRDYPGTSCASGLCDKIPSRYRTMIGKLKKTGTRYLLYEEKKWPKDKFDLKRAPYKTDFDIVGRWRHRDTGELILFKLKNGY